MKSIHLFVISDRKVKRLAIRFEYDPSLIALAKTIDGYGYHPEKRLWHYPFSKGSVDAIKQVFGKKEGYRLEPNVISNVS